MLSNFMRPILNRARALAAHALAGALPQACVLCAAPCTGSGLCAGCDDDLPRLATACCPVCALPTPEAQVCGTCLQAAPAFTASRAALIYRFPVDRLIQSFKFSHQVALARPLGDWVTECCRAADPPDALLPMPLHPARQRQRGFNQSLLLARRVGCALDIPVRADFACRQRATPSLAGHGRRERQRLIQNAFVASPSVQGLHLAVVDDVMTTGATLNELARTLLAAGALRVDCWVLARTPSPQD